MWKCGQKGQAGVLHNIMCRIYFNKTTYVGVMKRCRRIKCGQVQGKPVYKILTKWTNLTFGVNKKKTSGTDKNKNKPSYLLIHKVIHNVDK